MVGLVNQPCVAKQPGYHSNSRYTSKSLVMRIIDNQRKFNRMNSDANRHLIHLQLVFERARHKVHLLSVLCFYRA